MGAAFAGVFWGVLAASMLAGGTSMAAVVAMRYPASNLCGSGQRATYGAVIESIFLLRIGSDILAML